MTALPRLYALPSGGGSAALFRGWDAALAGRAEVVTPELPGRGARIAERPPAAFDEYVADLHDRHTPSAGEPWAVVGHSFGALLAAAWAARAYAEGRGPGLVVLSAAAPPWLHSTARVLLEGPDDGLWSRIEALGGLPEPVFAAPAARRLLGRALRADIRAAAEYRPAGPEPVGCPVLAVQGADDPLVTVELGGGWAALSDRGFCLDVLPGGHFYREGLADLLPVLRRALAGTFRARTALSAK